MIKIVAVLLALYAVVTLLLWFGQERLIFHPERLEPSFRFALREPFEERWLDVNETRLHGLFFRQPHAPGTILYLHGNAGSNQSWGSEAGDVARHTGWNVWMIDYPGYGKSEGRIHSEAQLHELVTHVYESAHREFKGRVVMFGRSLGTGLATRLAADSAVDGLILASPYYEMGAMAKARFPIVPSVVLRYPLPTHAWLPRVKAPVLIMHGDEDELIPFSHAERLAALIPRATFVRLRGSHHNDLDESPLYLESITRFLDNLSP